MDVRWGIVAALGLLAVGVEAARSDDIDGRPDVLFIAIDDLNDAIRLLDPRAPIRTPHLERLAARGVLFTRAYCASPACNPSRTAVLTGLATARTGVYGNRTDWRRALPEASTIPQHFRAHGYRAVGAGKIFHHHDGGAFHDPASFDDFRAMPDPPDAPMPPGKLNGLDGYGSRNTDWGPWPPEEADAVDVRTVDACIRHLEEPDGRPLFLAAGIFRPHMPFFAPGPYLDAYPLDRVALPTVPADDRDDLPPGALALLRPTGWFFEGITKAEAEAPGTWKDAVRAYQACASFADAQVGRLLDALDRTGRADRTVVVAWSDHGYHLGEKAHWEKFALWEKTTHVPLIVVAPGVSKAGARCERPVSLLDLYPTLNELCRLTPKPELDGRSLVPLLADPDAARDRPALMTYGPGNHAVRSERWRYIRYADGTEELYDEEADPDEWHNLAGDPDLAGVIAEHHRWLPQHDAPPAPDLKRRSRGTLD